MFLGITMNRLLLRLLKQRRRRLLGKVERIEKRMDELVIQLLNHERDHFER